MQDMKFLGTVIHGDGRGKTIGFPTANLDVAKNALTLPRGVYAVFVEYKGTTYGGMMNVGVRPTFKEGNHTLLPEVHIFHFAEDIYGEILEVEVLTQLREEKVFTGKEALIAQLQEDQQAAMHIVEEHSCC